MILSSIGIIDDERVLGNPVVNCYTSGTSTWCKCPGAQAVGIIVVGGGGGGGDSCCASTVGCNTFFLAGGGGGGGGGLSSCLLVSSSVPNTATVTIGAGGSRGAPATSGGTSCYTGTGLTVCAGGGGCGQRNGVPPQPGGYTNAGGPGGLGSFRGNTGGFGGQPGGNACNQANRARGGGGGGGSFYCNVLPTICCSYPSGSSSSATFYNPNWPLGCGCIDLTNFGAGGQGGNSSIDNARDFTVNGTNGNAGFVYVVQYF